MQQTFQCNGCGAQNYVGQPACWNCQAQFQYNCPSCHALVNPTNVNCPYCRFQLTWQSNQLAQPLNCQTQRNYQEPQVSTRRNPWLIGILMAILIIIIGGGTVFTIINWSQINKTPPAPLAQTPSISTPNATPSPPAKSPVNSDITPPLISQLKIRACGSSGAIISWVTDEPSSSQVEYGVLPYANTTTPIQNDPTTGVNSGVLIHEVALSNLLPSTSYIYSLISIDKYGNRSKIPDMRFDTAPQLNVPPVITRVEITTKAIKEVVIVWTTDQPSSSQVEWGTKGSFGNKTEIQDDPASCTTIGVLAHLIIVKGLTGNTDYQFRVISHNKDGFGSISDTNYFTTPSE